MKTYVLLALPINSIRLSSDHQPAAQWLAVNESFLKIWAARDALLSVQALSVEVRSIQNGALSRPLTCEGKEMI